MGSKEVAYIVHNLDYEEFASKDSMTITSGLEVRPIEVDLNSMTFWKMELEERLRIQADIPNRKTKKFFKKVNSKASFSSRQVIITLSTKPSRLKYIASVLSHIDLKKSNAIIVINLPKKFGEKGLEYSKIPVHLTENKRVVIKWLPEDLGPYSKILPTLRHLFFRATANTIADRKSRRLLNYEVYKQSS